MSEFENKVEEVVSSALFRLCEEIPIVDLTFSYLCKWIIGHLSRMQDSDDDVPELEEVPATGAETYEEDDVRRN